jgi:hypothetical protein
MTQKLRRKRSLGLALGLVIIAFAAGAAGPAKEISISMTFSDTYGDRIMSDGGGVYNNGLNSVSAVFDASGDTDLNTQASRCNRMLLLSFADPQTTPWSRPFLQQYVQAFLSTSAAQTLEGNPITNRLLGMDVGQIALTNLNINFSASGLVWFIRFNPSFSGATQVLVTRATQDTWIIYAAGANATAKLLSYPPKGKYVLTDRGNFLMPFELTVKLK